MIAATARLLERLFNLPPERTVPILRRLAVTLASLLFLLLATVVVAYDHFFMAQIGAAGLVVGQVAPRDILAPETRTYVSEVLTEQRRADAEAAVRPVYNPPNPGVARTQTRLAGQILDYMDNVRRDVYASPEQRVEDLRYISALSVEDNTLQQLVGLDSATWEELRVEISRLLEQVMRESIREVDLADTRERLPVQVSLQFDEAQTATIVALVEDLIRPNTTENTEATTSARQEARLAVPDEQRTFQRGQIVVRAGAQIGVLEYEALEKLGLLQPSDQRWQEIGRAFIAVIVVSVMLGLYLLRFNPSLLYVETRLLVLLAGIFLLTLLGVRLYSSEQIYLFPSALLALLYVAIVSPQVAIIGVTGLAVLAGITVNNSLEVTTLVLAGGIIGALALRRPERLNSYFVTGLLISLVSMTVAAVFNLGTPDALTENRLPILLTYAALSGILTAAAAIVGLYLIGVAFNLPTALKLVELSQPNQPLLQRLLREAPGTYQHSLQVANLSEQAANAIGANAALIHVAALYHDIGKVLNPAFFTENQRDIGNPHDALNDPYRSADIIMSHVTEGDAIARQNRLPRRLRDFIREHHGTSVVAVFYQQAVALAGQDEDAVEASDFTYPGPRPQSRETAILMLADTCEAAIRSIQPEKKQDIEIAVDRLIESKRREGQLDDSGLTLNDLAQIKRIFVDILKATFHPRINYAEAIARARGKPQGNTATGTAALPVVNGGTAGTTAAGTAAGGSRSDEKPSTGTSAGMSAGTPAAPSPAATTSTQTRLPVVKPTRTDTGMTPVVPRNDDDDDAPLPFVPPLPRASDRTDKTERVEKVEKLEQGFGSDAPPLPPEAAARLKQLQNHLTDGDGTGSEGATVEPRPADPRPADMMQPDPHPQPRSDDTPPDHTP